MRVITVTLVVFGLAVIGLAQAPQALYRVTIVSRTTKAINYGYLTAPTRIDFAGTPLLNGSRGEATVEPKRGSTLITARFKNVPPPSRFGAQFLTYVVWAISPEGRAQNLGELSLNGSGNGKLETSTPMQTFAMIVTAEPYYSVSQPSDVVVLENRVGSGTIGRVAEVNASYELLPRKEFTYDTGAPIAPAGKPLPRDQYDAVVALYQAQNAIQIAESKGAQKYAADRIARARDLYEKARKYPVSLSKDIVSLAREAAQIAEDSRAIAVKRGDEERAAAEQLRAEQAHRQAEETQAAAARTLMAVPPPLQQSVSPDLPKTTAAAAESTTSQTTPVEVDSTQFQRDQPEAATNRRRILSALQGRYEVVDSGRGIVVTVPEMNASSPALPSYLRPLVEAIRPYPDLHIEVDGHSATPDFALTQRQADGVRNALMRSGESGDRIMARGFGNSRPRTSNASVSGRAQNQRVEIVIAGDAIGSLPTWDRKYALVPGR